MIPGSSSCEGGPTTGEPLAAAYLRERRLSMSDCLEVLESERFRKTRKQRAAAWQNNQPPSIHTTLGAFQRGPWTGLTYCHGQTRRSRNYVLTLGDFTGGGIWQEGSCEGASTVAMQLESGEERPRFVVQVRDRLFRSTLRSCTRLCLGLVARSGP